MGYTHISREQGIDGKGATFTFIVRTKYYQDILDGDNKGKSPDDERQSAQKIVVRRLRGECRRIDVEWAGSNVAVDDSNGLVGQPHKRPPFEDLLLGEGLFVVTDTLRVDRLAILHAPLSSSRRRVDLCDGILAKVDSTGVCHGNRDGKRGSKKHNKNL